MCLWNSIALRIIPKPVRRLIHRGTARFCPVCGASVKGFRSFGVPPRKEAQCPVCYSLERHRLIWRYFRERTDLFDGKPKRLLHIAPEPQLGRLLRRLPGVDYVSADLAARKAMVCADVTNLPFRANEFDVIYCSHVLEHVPDDRKAMSEFCRVLRPNGWAILQVPLRGQTTFEDPSITSPEDRLRWFGQEDHVRIYGADYKERLEGAGFQVTIDPFAQSLPESEVQRMAIDRGEDVFFCRPRG